MNKELKKYREKLGKQLADTLEEIIKNYTLIDMNLQMISAEPNVLDKIKNIILYDLLNINFRPKETAKKLTNTLYLINQCNSIIDEIKKVDIISESALSNVKNNQTYTIMGLLPLDLYTRLLSPELYKYIFRDFIKDDNDTEIESTDNKKNDKYPDITKSKIYLNSLLSIVASDMRITANYSDYQIYKIYDINTKEEYKFTKIIEESYYFTINQIFHDVLSGLCDEKYIDYRVFKATGNIFNQYWKKYTLTDKSYKFEYIRCEYESNTDHYRVGLIYKDNNTSEKYVLVDALQNQKDKKKYYILKNISNSINVDNINMLTCINSDEFKDRFERDADTEVNIKPYVQLYINIMHNFKDR